MCDFPIIIKLDPPREKEGEIYEAFPADCGKCLPCLRKRKSQWSFRLMEEKKKSFSSYFVTLTYDDDHIKYGGNYMTGDRKDHKDFIKFLKYYEAPKRLMRRSMISLEELTREQVGIKEKGKLSYYGIIEYGDREGRPHLHYLLFNVRDTYNINRAWSDQVRGSEVGEKRDYYPIRQKGIIDIDEMNINTIDYVLKYMLKNKHDKNEFEGREKELQFISKGLGVSFVEDSEEVRKYIKKENGNQVVNMRGIKIALPRYYNKKFLTEEEREIKGNYIADRVMKEKIKEDIEFEKMGKDPSLARREIAENRIQILKNRKKRDLK